MRRYRLGRVVGAAAFVGSALLGWAGPARADSITTAGPLTTIVTSTDLNCSVNHTGDADGEWFDDTACGTFVALGGVLYGPASIPAGGNLDNVVTHTPWTPVSQTTGGTGTAADPDTITTVVAGGSAVQVTQVDSYVIGQESMLTTVMVKNTTASSETLKMYRAGDCFLADSDVGFGRVDTVSAGSAPTCVGLNPLDNSQPGTRIEQLLPLTAGSHYVEDNFDTVWGDIGSMADLPNTCQCATAIDNGAGLSWAFTLAAGVSQSFSHLSTFSPTGVTPVVATKTADAPSVAAGAQDGYTVKFTNANSAAVTLDSITDTLPTGFAYVADSTTGGVTANPTVTGSQAVWTGPFSVPAGGNLTFHFLVTVSATSGTFTNSVTASSTTDAVAPAVATAPITVGGSPTTTTTTTTVVGTTTTTIPVVSIPALPPKGIPVAVAIVAAIGFLVWFRRRRSAGTLP